MVNYADQSLSKFPGVNPHQAEVLRVDDHMPAVGIQELSPEALRRRFSNPPIWEPDALTERKVTGRVITPASVLIPIVMRATPTVLLTQRSQHLSSHSGQVSFPGGKRDQEDADEIAVALRETQEEIGLDLSFVSVLGCLPNYLTGTAYLVTPVVALVDVRHSLQVNYDEVAEVFEVPLAFLMNPANHRHHHFEAGGLSRDWLSIPYQDEVTNRFIWGVTAGILRNLYRFLVASIDKKL